MNTLFDILKLLGSLGVFIFGMKLMSDGIQKIAGSKLRSLLSTITRNRLSGIFTGFTTTALVQSSSATTVMVVSFVNAGLLTLIEASGVIMGANIGTTVTAWLVSLLGFGKVKIASIALMFIGVSFPFYFSNRDKLRNIAEFVIGFGILFTGLEFLKDSVPDLKANPEILLFLNQFTDFGFLSTLIFIGVGTLLTVIVQSSSASTAITLIMVAQGWIGFEIAAAMVLGENIGTTITANIAALIGNIHAKRAARFHTLFNLIGVFWMLIVFHLFIDLVNTMNQAFFSFDMDITSTINPDSTEELRSTHALVTTRGLALFHTTFNVVNTALLFFFAPFLVKLVTRITRSSNKQEEEYKLQFIGADILATPELSIEEAKKELQHFGKRVEQMCQNVISLIFDDVKNPDKMIAKIKKREEHTDELHHEITTYLTKLSGFGISQQVAKKIRGMIRMAHDMERMGDIFYQVSLNLKRMRNQNIQFPESVKVELNDYFNQILDGIRHMNKNLMGRGEDLDLKEVYEMEEIINDTRDKLKLMHFDRIENAVYPVSSGIIFLDFVNSAEKLGDHIVNVSQAIDSMN